MKMILIVSFLSLFVSSNTMAFPDRLETCMSVAKRSISREAIDAGLKKCAKNIPLASLDDCVYFAKQMKIHENQDAWRLACYEKYSENMTMDSCKEIVREMISPNGKDNLIEKCFLRNITKMSLDACVNVARSVSSDDKKDYLNRLCQERHFPSHNPATEGTISNE